MPPLPAPALGIDLGGTKIEAAVLDAHGTIVWGRRVATPVGRYDATVGALIDLVAAADAAAAAGPAFGAPWLSVGVGHPGASSVGGLIKNANSTCLNGRALQRDLEHRLGRPVRLANDANCLALSEATDGAAAGADVAFAVILGTGCGAGIAVHGQVLHGVNGLAGEWGHNPLPWPTADDPPPLACYCGQRGCIETTLSGPAVRADHGRRTGRDLT
ncbi:MAG: ROK family protein, partial [Rubrivivax sp.]